MNTLRWLSFTIALSMMTALLPSQPFAQSETGYTVLVYMNGSDLESKDNAGSATSDLNEMLAANFSSDKVKVVVETGGTKSWVNPNISNTVNQRWLIEQGKLVALPESPGNRSMGDPNTLKDFVSWGMKNYPAKQYALIFWNHGAGAVNGFGFDELNESDPSLSLPEIQKALSETYAQTQKRIELVGFDACLMATLETAHMLKDYASYLVASEELEPGHGWNYTPILNAITANPSISGAALGKIIADTYKDHAQDNGTASAITLSVMDLSKIGAVVDALDTLSTRMNGELDDISRFSAISNGRGKAEDYGSAEAHGGSTDMADLKDIAQNYKALYPDLSENLINSIGSAVTYNINSKSKNNASGISIYFPFKDKDNFETNLQTYQTLDFSKNYQTFVSNCVKKVLGGKADITIQQSSLQQEPPTESVDPDGASEPEPDPLELDPSELDPSELDPSELDPSELDPSELDPSELDPSELDPSEPDPSELPEDTQAPYDDNYKIRIDPADLEYISEIYSVIGTYDPEDPDKFITLGLDSDVTLNETTGELEDNFTGYWVTLGGHFVSMFLDDEDENYSTYPIPILLNGESVNLMVIYNYENDESEIIGANRGIDPESGMMDKNILPINEGDSIVPLFMYEKTDGEQGFFEGEAFLADDNFALDYEPLPEGVYSYGFLIEDIFQEQTYTDFIDVEITEAEEAAYQASDASDKKLRVSIDNRNIAFDVPPTIVDGRTLVPLRGIFEALGIEVGWDAATSTITGTRDGLEIIMQLGNKEVLVNGERFTLDVPATIIDGRTMVPARFIAQSTGYTVDWDGAQRKVLISTSK